ncbi:MAG: dihydrolipoyl dehydrogenase family protein [Promethearchaeota archaeon]
MIGAGTSGFPSAKIAANYGKKVLLLGEGALGGKCLEKGCIPSKAMIYATNLYKSALRAKDFGIHIENITINFNEVLNYADTLVHKGIQGNEEQIALYENIDYVKKNGHCLSQNSIEVGNEVYTASNILISTGTFPRIPPIEGINEVDFLTHETIFNLRKLPESILFVGGGFISLEFANVFNIFGSKVYIIESNPHLIHRADEIVSSEIEKYYKEDGIEFYPNQRTAKVHKSSKEIIVETTKGNVFNVEKVMISTGFIPNTQGLKLEAAGVELDARGNILVNEYLQTSQPNIYAIGDIIGKSQFTHMALRESKMVIHNIFNDDKVPVSFENIPYAAFTDPPIGSVGKTTQELDNAREDYKVLISTYPSNSRGNLMKLKRGLIKLIYNENKILGCHIIGESADILIHEIVPLLHLSDGLSIFRKLVHAHPTLSELYRNLQDQIGFF